MTKILLIGNENGSAADLIEFLNGGQFHVECATSEAEAVHSLAFSEPDIILLDSVSPDSNATSLCQRLRKLYGIPIVVCSTSGREHDIVRALEAGADEYLVLPVRSVELVARLRAVIRRGGEKAPLTANGRILEAGDIELRLAERQAFRNGVPLDLSPIEFKLLAILVRESGRAVSHSKLMAYVWGPEFVDSRHYLRLYIRYLRTKIEDDPQSPELILNEWGIGYRFEPKQARVSAV